MITAKDLQRARASLIAMGARPVIGKQHAMMPMGCAHSYPICGSCGDQLRQGYEAAATAAPGSPPGIFTMPSYSRALAESVAVLLERQAMAEIAADPRRAIRLGARRGKIGHF